MTLGIKTLEVLKPYAYHWSSNKDSTWLLVILYLEHLKRDKKAS